LHLVYQQRLRHLQHLLNLERLQDQLHQLHLVCLEHLRHLQHQLNLEHQQDQQDQ
jgi:hypothetical protein